MNTNVVKSNVAQFYIFTAAITIAAVLSLAAAISDKTAREAVITPPPCQCCGAACACVDCVCDAEGCACSVGGKCACNASCGVIESQKGCCGGD